MCGSDKFRFDDHRRVLRELKLHRTTRGSQPNEMKMMTFLGREKERGGGEKKTKVTLL